MQTRGNSALDWSYCTAKATELLCVTLKDAAERKSNGIKAPRMSASDQRLLHRRVICSRSSLSSRRDWGIWPDESA